MLNAAPNQPNENIASVSLPGIIKSVDYINARAIVTIAGIDTPPLPWTERTGTFKTWNPPEIDEQVEVITPDGDFANGVIFGGCYYDENPQIGDDENPKFQCGAVTIKIIKATGKVEITAPEIAIAGDLKVTGKIDATGNIHSDTDVLAGAVSLHNHKHLLVKAGTDKSGVPE